MTAQNALATVRTVADLRARIKEWRAQGLRVALVPTMGALHDGHLSLVRHALTLADRVCVTLFVNPKQFGPTEDFAVYPRREAEDAALLAGAGAHLLYAPPVEVMYPQGFSTSVAVSGISAGLCGAFRPDFLGGVATVVTKLLLQALPDVAIFGEKDYQQLQVIKTLVRDLDIPVEIQGAPTVREADGLALSSRNAYLSPEQRAIAPAIYRVLGMIAEAVANGADIAQQRDWGRSELLKAGFASVDYLELCDAVDLKPVDKLTRPARLLVAAWLGTARLIDNIAVLPK